MLALFGTDELKATDKGCMIEGSLEVKLPTIWTDEKQSWAEVWKLRCRKSARRFGAKHICM